MELYDLGPFFSKDQNLSALEKNGPKLIGWFLWEYKYFRNFFYFLRFRHFQTYLTEMQRKAPHDFIGNE